MGSNWLAESASDRDIVGTGDYQRVFEQYTLLVVAVYGSNMLFIKCICPVIMSRSIKGLTGVNLSSVTIPVIT